MPTLNLGAPSTSGRWYQPASSSTSWPWGTPAEVGQDGTYGSSPTRKRLKAAGLRWAGVDVPQGATITSAALGFSISEGMSFDRNVLVHAVDDAPALATGQQGTTAVGSSPYDAGTGAKTVDITAQIQGLADRSGWSAGNALVARIDGEASTNATIVGSITGVTLTITYEDPSTDYVLTVEDTIGVEDATSVALGLARTVHDDIPVVDDTQSLMPMSREATDQVAIGDTATALLVPGTPRTAADSVPVVDQVTVGYHPANTHTTTDALPILDQVAVSLVAFAPPPPPWQDALTDPEFLAAVRAYHRVTGWRIEVITPTGVVLTEAPPIVEQGSITCDGDRPYRWAATLHVPDPAWYPHRETDVLHPYSRHTIQLYWQLQNPRTGSWWDIPLGRYYPTLSDKQTDADAPPAGFDVPCVSALGTIRAYLTPIDVSGMRLHTAIDTILSQVAPNIPRDLTPSMDSMPSTYWVGQPYGGDPVADCHAIAAAGGMVLHESETGVIRLDPISSATTTADWSHGVVQSITVKQQDSSQAVNTVRVTGTSRDLEVPVYATAQLTDPDDPLSILTGQYLPDRVADQYVRTTAQAQARADMVLAERRERTTGVTVIVLPQPHRRPGEVVTLARPEDGAVGPHRITGWTWGLDPTALMGVLLRGVIA